MRDPTTGRVNLSKQDINVLALVAKGLKAKEIGHVLEVSENTVKRHLYRMKRAYGTHNATHSACEALRLGIIP